MKFKMHSYLDEGASIQYKFIQKTLSDLENLFSELSIEKYETFVFEFVVSGDMESIAFKSQKLGKIVVEYRYPLSEFKKIKIKDKASILASLVINALMKLYASENLSLSEIESLKFKHLSLDKE